MESFTFWSLIRIVSPHRGALGLALVLMLGESAVSLATPWLAGQFTHALLTNGTVLGLSLRVFLLVWLGVLLVQSVMRFANRYLLGCVGEDILAELRTRLFDHLQALPLSWHHERRRNEIMSLMANDVGEITGFVTGTLVGLLPNLLTFIGALVFVFLINPLVGWIVFALLPLFFLVAKIIGRRIRPLARRRIDQYGKMYAMAGENVELIPLIKSFTREPIESRRFRSSNQELVAISRRYLWISALMSPVIRFAAASGIVVLLWIGIGQVQAGLLSAPDLVSLLLYGLILTGPLSGLADTWGRTQTARGASGRLIEVFSQEPEPPDTGIVELSSVKGAVRFENVVFGYPGRNRLFDGFELNIAAGETLAITGRNGAGKSTLVHLLARFIEPEAGRILIDGVDIRDISIASLRRQIGMVQQHVLLLNGSVRDNLLFGRPDANDEQLREALRLSHATEFIDSLPFGLHTVIGDQGIRLSGGQRQRLALARALLKDPPILVLDEATAMFDPEGESIFIEQSQGTLMNRTVILITHRPASLALADRVIEL